MGDFFTDTAIDEFLLDAAKFGKFGENSLPAKSDEEIGGVADRGVGGEAGETVGTAAFEAEGELRQGRGLTDGFVCFDEPQKGFPDGFRKHGRFGSAFLLLEDEKRLAEMRIATLYLFEQIGDLRMLTAQAENGCAGYVGMMNVTGEQAAEIA